MTSRTVEASLRFIATRVVLILLGALAGVAAMEVALRLFPLPNRFVLMERIEGLWESDSQLLLHLKPNMTRMIYGHPEFRFTVRTNAEGLRDDPLAMDQAVAAIGDSFTFGFGVEGEEAWPEILESMSSSPVANLGFAGWNSYVYPAAIRRYAIPHHARLWLWAFFVNDLTESSGAEEFFASGRTDFKAWAVENGFLGKVSAFPYNLRTAQLLAALFNRDLFLLPDSGSGVVSTGDIRVRYDDYPWRMTDPANPSVQKGWGLTETALLEANRLAAENGATLVVIFIPSREHAYWPYLQSVMTDVDVQQLDEAEARLAGFSQNHGIGYLNLLPAFREAAIQGEMLYFSDDGHWNPRGHDLAARTIHAFLEQRQWLPYSAGGSHSRGPSVGPALDNHLPGTS